MCLKGHSNSCRKASWYSGKENPAKMWWHSVHAVNQRPNVWAPHLPKFQIVWESRTWTDEGIMFQL